MKRLLVPLILLLLGLGGGVGAGLALAPPAEDPEAAALAAEMADPCGAAPAHEPAAEGEAAMAEGHGTAEASSEDGEATAEGDAAERGDAAAGHDYVKLPNQFVVPLLDGGEVTALVLMSLSVEVATGGQEEVLLIEPKLRDVFLQALFDHANTGGFDGLFTAASAMRSLRATLHEAAMRVAGDVVTDVLIVELVRQDK